MTNSNVTTEMLYDQLNGLKETIRDFKEDFKIFKYEVYNRFDQIDKRFEHTDRRFEQMDKSFVKIESQQSEDRKVLMDLFEHRDNMKLSLTRTLLTVTGLVSGIVAFIVSFITGKAIILKS